MNNNHLISVLDALADFKKEEAITDSVVGVPYFAQLCKCLERRAQHYGIDDVITVIKILSLVGLPSDSSTLQTYFQMLRHQINDVTLNQITYLDFLLKKQKRIPLVEALLIALPMVLENQLDVQLNSNNMHELVKLFEYGVRNNVRPKSLKKIADAVLESPVQMDASSALTVIWCYIKMKHQWTFEQDIFNKALEEILRSIHRIAPLQLVKITNALSRKDFFCGPLLDVIGRRAVDEAWPLSFLQSLVATMVNVDTIDLDVLERYSKLIVKNQDEVILGPKFSIYTVMEAFERANYAPDNVRDVMRIALDCTDKIRVLSEHPALFVKFALMFATFDCFPPGLFDRLNSGKYKERLMSSVKATVPSDLRTERLRKLLLLSQVSEDQRLRFDWPENLKFEGMEATKDERATQPSILKALLGALGGPQYVLSSIFTKSGLHVDHFVVLRQGNYPVALTETPVKKRGNFTYVEDVAVPVDSKRIAIIVHQSADVTADGKRIHGLAQLPVRLLGREGFHVVEINLTTWERIPEHEKIPYVMRNIEENVTVNAVGN